MANVAKGLRELSFAEASKMLAEANTKLQGAPKGIELCKAALEFAAAERTARSAKARETSGSILDGLNEPTAKAVQKK